MSLMLAALVVTSAAPVRLAVLPALMPSLSKRERTALKGVDAVVLNTLAAQGRWVLVDEAEVASLIKASPGPCADADASLSPCLTAVAAGARAQGALAVQVKALGPGRFTVAVTAKDRELDAPLRTERVLELAAGAAIREPVLRVVNELLAALMLPTAEPLPPPPVMPAQVVAPVEPPPAPPQVSAPPDPRPRRLGPLVTLGAGLLGAACVIVGLVNANEAQGVIGRARMAGLMGPPWPAASLADAAAIRAIDGRSSLTLGLGIGAAITLVAGVLLWVLVDG